MNVRLLLRNLRGTEIGGVHPRHRDVAGGAPRAAVLGAGDGLITNVSIIVGVAGANSTGSLVRLAGISGLLAGAFSMAAGELVSVRAQDELKRREIEMERRELVAAPEDEQQELEAMYRARGIPDDEAAVVAAILSAHHEIALDTHSRLELGIDPDATGSAAKASGVSFISFGVGAVLPLVPWFFAGGAAALVASVVIGAVAAAALGGAIGAFTGRGVLRTAVRQLLVAAVAAGVTYAVGSFLGVSTT